LTSTYDANGNRTNVQDSKGGVTTSTYDNANNLTSRQFSNGTTPLREDFTYDANNQLSTATRYSDLNANTKIGGTSYSYDTVNRLSTLQHRNVSGTLYSNYTYTYDPSRRVQNEVLNGTTQTFTYDTTDQLTNDGTNSWSYNSTGNRTNTGYNTTTGNQLQTDGTWTYTWDAEGNLTKKSKGASAETWTYGYDNRNELLWAEDHATDGGAATVRDDFKYDAFGLRIEKDDDGAGPHTASVSRFAYDAWKVMLDAAGAKKARFVGTENWDVWVDLDGSNALQVRYLYGDGVDQRLARINAAGTAAWYALDRL